jgi:hypothetical protein
MFSSSINLRSYLVTVSQGMILLLLLAGCDLVSSTPDPATEQTQTAISLQQTEVAEKMGQLSIEDRQATQDALSALGGQDSGNESGDEIDTADTSPSETPEAATEPAAQAPTPTDTLEPTQSIDFESWMQSANILLFEDMVNHLLDTNRYVQGALDEMGLSYKDDGSAKGWLKTDLVGGAPDGEPWDLVIIAAESKTGVQGEFFEYVLDALDRGSSVIMEVWYLDQTYNGSAGALLDRCGIEFENNWRKVPPLAMVMFPVDSSHPILFEPNNLSFTDVYSYWWDPDGEIVYDIGDQVKLAPGSDARILVATNANYKDSHGTLTVCVDGRLILQTFSSHQLTYNASSLIWQNYIYNALKVRFENLQQ